MQNCDHSISIKLTKTLDSRLRARAGECDLKRKTFVITHVRRTAELRIYVVYDVAIGAAVSLHCKFAHLDLVKHELRK